MGALVKISNLSITFFAKLPGWGGVRRVLGVLLIAAASLKAQDWLAGLEGGLVESPLLRYGRIGAEFLLGLWLLLDIFSTFAWSTCLISFLSFLAYTVHRGFTGQSSCGCFGHITVSPWLTAAFDACVLGILLGSQPDRTSSSPFDRYRAIEALGLALLAMAPAGLVPISWAESAVTFPDIATSRPGTGRVVFLSPEQWLGRQFPLMGHVYVDADLERGDWLVVLHRTGCVECRKILPDYEAMAARGPMHVALLELPPFGPRPDDKPEAGPGLVRGRLDETFDWFAKTPAVIALRDGVVVKLQQIGASD